MPGKDFDSTKKSAKRDSFGESDLTCRVCHKASGKYNICLSCKRKTLESKRPQGTGIIVTDELRTEVRRRLSKFEAPTSIARALGLSQDQINAIIHPEKYLRKKAKRASK